MNNAFLSPPRFVLEIDTVGVFFAVVGFFFVVVGIFLPPGLFNAEGVVSCWSVFLYSWMSSIALLVNKRSSKLFQYKAQRATDLP